MKTVLLFKQMQQVIMAGEVFTWEGVGNWPFPGGRDYDWGQGHRCSCGNQRFLVCHALVEIPVEGAEPIHKHEYRNVCGQCIRFHATEMILGEIDYADMIVLVYDSPESPARARSAQVDQNAMNLYIPINADYFDLTWFDNSRFYWRPEQATPPVPEPASMRAAPKRGRKGKIRPTGPVLNGFPDETT